MRDLVKLKRGDERVNGVCLPMAVCMRWLASSPLDKFFGGRGGGGINRFSIRMNRRRQSASIAILLEVCFVEQIHIQRSLYVLY